MLTPLRLFPDEGETIEGVGAAIRAGRTSCAAVLEHCFHQIDLWDERVRAWVVVDRAGAMRQARALDAQLGEGLCLGPLHGIPIGIKDIIDVQGLPTAAGFRPWRERVADRDAAVVSKLRAGGAVILGKTATTQFAWIDPPPTRNPWNPEHTPGGSSSGSAAAVATGMCLGAIGTQTGGSIIRPASFCGVAGFKPQYMFLPSEGVLPLSPTLDHPGPIARTVRDLFLVYRCLFDEGDGEFPNEANGSSPAPTREVDLRIKKALGEQTLDVPPTLLRPRGFFDRRAGVGMLDAFEKALGALTDAGAGVIDVPDDAIDFEGILREHRTLMASEAATVHESSLAENPDDYSPQIRALVEEGRGTPVTRYIRSVYGWRKPRSWDALFSGAIDWEEHPGPKALVTPATVGPAPDTTTTGNPCFNAPFSYLGWPTLSFPIGLSGEGLPLALQLAGPPFLDPFATACWCESVIRRTEVGGIDR